MPREGRNSFQLVSLWIWDLNFAFDFDFSVQPLSLLEIAWNKINNKYATQLLGETPNTDRPLSVSVCVCVISMANGRERDSE